MSSRAVPPSTMSRVGSRITPRSVLAGLFGLALLVGVPVGLWLLVGNPLDRFPSSFDVVRDGVSRRHLPSDWIVGALAIVMWLLWLQYVWALLWELIVVGPAVARGALVRSAPLAPRVIRSLVSTVVSGMLTASVVTGGSSLAAVGSHLLNDGVVLAADLDDAAAGTGPVDADLRSDLVGHRVLVVGPGESLWSISGQSDVMVKRLLELNEHQLRSPVDVRPGMELVVPPSLAGDPAPVSAGPALGRAVGASSNDHHHAVVEGDNLWNIAEARIQVEGDGDPANREIAERVADIVEANPDVIEDPDLIYPGEVLELADDPRAAVPAPPIAPPERDPSNRPGLVDVVSAVGEVSEIDVAGEAGAVSQAGAAGDVEASPEAQADEVPTMVGISSVVDAGPPAVPAAPVMRSEEVAGAEVTPSPEDGPGDGVGVAAVVAGAMVAGMAGATALLLAVLGLRNRRNGAFGVGFVRREDSGDANRLILDLVEHSDTEFVAWCAARVDELVTGLPPTAVPPVAVRLAFPGRLGGDSGLVVDWEEHPSSADPDWEQRSDGSWARSYDEAAARSESPGLAAIPGLVTVGELAEGSDRGRQLLVDLEAFGSLALGGSPEEIWAVARAMVLEAAAAEELSNIIVTTVDHPIEGTTRFDRVSTCPEDVALERAETIRAQHEAMSKPGPGHGPGLEGGHGGTHDVELFIVETVSADTDRWLEIARPRSGLAVLLVGDMRSSRLGARLAIDSTGIATLDPLGEKVVVAGMQAETVGRLGDLFDRFLQEPMGDEDLAVRAAPEVVRSQLAVTGATRPPAPPLAVRAGPDDRERGLADADTEPVTGESVVIQVLGPCRCESRPGLAARALSLVAYLAVRGDRSADIDAAIRAVWGGRAVSEAQFAKVEAAVRSHLGPERFGKRRSDDPVLRVRGVETDLDHFQRLVLEAGAAEPQAAGTLLRTAMDLVSGPPFTGVSLGWAVADGLVDYAAELIESTTVQAVHLLTAIGRPEDARSAAQRGLLALPGSEPIYRAYMRMSVHLGDPGLARATYDYLENSLSALYPTENRRPSPETRRLLADLLAGSTGSGT